ncbi:uncharacterized protein AMSG_08857 [Thecamonas trahens ATCC 50062]|uniref:Las1-domain-containing protein n=1 Tax=Thecamonas trahens ATCC 50062 TaxID=461836 RepID=A0A0L0DMU3_THETB|nr:hypothetical protein AMSG_08857 [Thecamonas trahens ATCC 50062]KNC53356.1 hypothetical protein AMSG_08857 [Thecamonas trahens ATCC 50062]|eukprot:XP_013754402.1 hypothetical protein AMSG_08857 [Thecamonas trahens ATCC 50062]
MARGPVPISVESTAGLLRALLTTAEWPLSGTSTDSALGNDSMTNAKNDGDVDVHSEQFDDLDQQALDMSRQEESESVSAAVAYAGSHGWAQRLELAMAITRFVNGTTDRIMGEAGASVSRAANSLGIPIVCVEVRHEATHRHMPALPQLIHAARCGLAWLAHRYWNTQKAAIGTERTRLTAMVTRAAKIRAQRMRLSDGVVPPDAVRGLDEQELDMITKIAKKDTAGLLGEILFESFLVITAAFASEPKPAKVFWWDVLYALGLRAPSLIPDLFTRCLMHISSTPTQNWSHSRALRWASLLIRSNFAAILPLTLLLELAAAQPTPSFRKLVSRVVQRSSAQLPPTLAARFDALVEIFELSAGDQPPAPVLCPQAPSSSAWSRVSVEKWRPLPLGALPMSLANPPRRGNVTRKYHASATGPATRGYASILLAPNPRPSKRRALLPRPRSIDHPTAQPADADTESAPPPPAKPSASALLGQLRVIQ